MDIAEYLTVVSDPNPPYSPIEAIREIEESLVALSRSTTCVPGTVRLHPADMLKLQSAMPITDYPAPPDVTSLLNCAVIVDPEVPIGAPQWRDCRAHDSTQACRLRLDVATADDAAH